MKSLKKKFLQWVRRTVAGPFWDAQPVRIRADGGLARRAHARDVGSRQIVQVFWREKL